MYQRNLKKEAEWKKNKYSRIVLDIDKAIGERFKEKAKENGQTISEILKKTIEEYINE